MYRAHRILFILLEAVVVVGVARTSAVYTRARKFFYIFGGGSFTANESCLCVTALVCRLESLSLSQIINELRGKCFKYYVIIFLSFILQYHSLLIVLTRLLSLFPHQNTKRTRANLFQFGHCHLGNLSSFVRMTGLAMSY